MADEAIEVRVVLSPTLTRPPELEPLLKAGMDTAVERVRGAGEASIASRTRAGGGARWQPRRGPKGGARGYGPLGGSLTTHAQVSTVHAGAVGYVGTPVFYSRFLEYGTKAHPIAAKHTRAGGRPGMLAFASAAASSAPGAQGPFLIFRRRVKQPGIAARFWMKSAADGEAAAVIGIFEDKTRAWAQAFAFAAPPAGAS